MLIETWQLELKSALSVKLVIIYKQVVMNFVVNVKKVVLNALIMALAVTSAWNVRKVIS